MLLFVRQGDTLDRRDLLARLVEARYDRNDYELKRAASACGRRGRDRARVRGERHPVELFGTSERISAFDPSPGRPRPLAQVRSTLEPLRHSAAALADRVKTIETELMEVKPRLETQGKLLERSASTSARCSTSRCCARPATATGSRTTRHLSGRRRESRRPPSSTTCQGCAPRVDESHQSIRRCGGCTTGPPAQTTLVEYGFRLPRPRQPPPELRGVRGEGRQALYVSATPGPTSCRRRGASWWSR